MVIVDSSVWIDAINGVPSGQAVWLNRWIDREPIGLTSLIFCEVLQGMRGERRFREVRDELQLLPVFEKRGSCLSTVPTTGCVFPSFREIATACTELAG